MTSKIFLFIFLSFTFLSAQEKSKSYLDSLYKSFVTLKAPQSSSEDYRISSAPHIIKCGLGVITDVKSNLGYFTQEQQNILKKLLDRPSLQTSIVSPSGLFRIHFDNTGNGVPNYVQDKSPLENANYAAIAFDSAYNYEVNYLGYPAPPKDGSRGGDDLYDVYIHPITGYGSTSPEDEISSGSGKYYSFIEVHNSFIGDFSTHGIAALSVSAAHEFHHMIQVGNYIFRDEDRYFMEMTSTSMEEFVFDDVNDYYSYMPTYFNNPSRPFSSFGAGNQAYDFAIWNIFLADTLGIDIIKKQWELMPQTGMVALNAIKASLENAGTSFSEMMNKFGVWCYYTGYRFQPGLYFEEAEDYPTISTSKIDFNSTSKPVTATAFPASNTYIVFVNKQGSFPDTLTALISNSDYKTGVDAPRSVSSFTYTLYNYNESGSNKLTDNYYYKFDVEKPLLWSTSQFLNNELVDSGTQVIPFEIDYAYPSPFYYNRHSTINIPVKDVDYYGGTYINIYTAGMELIYSSPAVPDPELNGKLFVKWNGFDGNGKKLPSGVYIYAIRSGDNTSTGKLVIFNE